MTTININIESINKEEDKEKEEPKKIRFSKNSIIKLSKKADIQSISKDCIPIIDTLIQEKLEKIIQFIITTNKTKIYTLNDIELALQIFEYKNP